MLRVIVPIYEVPEPIREDLIGEVKKIGLIPTICETPKQAIRCIVDETIPLEERPKLFLALPSECGSTVVDLASECDFMILRLSRPVIIKLQEAKQAKCSTFLGRSTPMVAQPY